MEAVLSQWSEARPGADSRASGELTANFIQFTNCGGAISAHAAQLSQQLRQIYICFFFERARNCWVSCESGNILMVYVIIALVALNSAVFRLLVF